MGKKLQRIAREILRMAKADQEMRIGEQKGGREWDSSLDKKNTARMKKIVEEIGWPTKSKVCKKASHMAWLLVNTLTTT